MRYIKEFPKVTEEPHKLADKFDITIQAYQSRFSDLKPGLTLDENCQIGTTQKE